MRARLAFKTFSIICIHFSFLIPLDDLEWKKCAVYSALFFFFFGGLCIAINRFHFFLLLCSVMEYFHLKNCKHFGNFLIRWDFQMNFFSPKIIRIISYELNSFLSLCCLEMWNLWPSFWERIFSVSFVIEYLWVFNFKLVHKLIFIFGCFKCYGNYWVIWISSV